LAQTFTSITCSETPSLYAREQTSRPCRTIGKTLNLKKEYSEKITINEYNEKITMNSGDFSKAREIGHCGILENKGLR
jgi:hypothetical protein